MTHDMSRSIQIQFFYLTYSPTNLEKQHPVLGALGCAWHGRLGAEWAGAPPEGNITSYVFLC